MQLESDNQTVIDEKYKSILYSSIEKDGGMLDKSQVVDFAKGDKIDARCYSCCYLLQKTIMCL